MHTDDTLTRAPIGEEEGRAGASPYEAGWSTLLPSTSPPLSRAEHDALPRGMVFVSRWPATRRWRAYLVDEPGAHRLWRMGAWGPPIRPAWDRCLEALCGDPDTRLPLLPRLSFSLTTEAIRKRQKTVTRRLSRPRWWKEGAWFLGVDRIRQAGAQGLCIARCGPANYEPLGAISQSEVEREGFPDTTPEGFCAMFRATAPRSWDGWLWRLPFTYLETPT